jgi:L-asparaginase
MNPAEWAKIATVIADNYKLFDGFVVLHGSDTMSSASALSFMLENLDL